MNHVFHSQNIGFVWASLPASATSQLEKFDRDGYFVSRGLLDKQTVAALTGLIDSFEQQTTEFLRTLPDQRLFIADADAITFSPHLVSRSVEARQFVTQPALAALAHSLLGPDVRLYWDQAVYKKPEPDREFPWHQDNGYTFVEPQNYLTCWIPLTSATVDNGCPWVVPGVHRLGTLHHETTDYGYRCSVDADAAVAVEAEPGDVVVFSSLTPHRTGPNRTASVRKAYIVQYAPDGAEAVHSDNSGGWVRTPQNDPVRQFVI